MEMVSQRSNRKGKDNVWVCLCVCNKQLVIGGRLCQEQLPRMWVWSASGADRVSVGREQQ